MKCFELPINVLRVFSYLDFVIPNSVVQKYCYYMCNTIEMLHLLVITFTFTLLYVLDLCLPIYIKIEEKYEQLPFGQLDKRHNCFTKSCTLISFWNITTLCYILNLRTCIIWEELARLECRFFKFQYKKKNSRGQKYLYILVNCHRRALQQFKQRKKENKNI